MKKRHFASVIFFLMTGWITQSFAQSEGAILGVWYNTEKTAQVEISKQGSQFVGKIIWLQEPYPNGKPATDLENSDPKLRTRPLMGMAILKDLTYEGGMWKGGEIYDPKSGKTYSCEIKLKNPELLEVKGYVGFSFVGRTVEWTRVKR
jgi:uncharacterized protein (DUF2147 family)